MSVVSPMEQALIRAVIPNILVVFPSDPAWSRSFKHSVLPFLATDNNGASLGGLLVFITSPDSLRIFSALSCPLLSDREQR